MFPDNQSCEGCFTRAKDKERSENSGNAGALAVFKVQRSDYNPQKTGTRAPDKRRYRLLLHRELK